MAGIPVEVLDRPEFRGFIDKRLERQGLVSQGAE